MLHVAFFFLTYRARLDASTARVTCVDQPSLRIVTSAVQPNGMGADLQMERSKKARENSKIFLVSDPDSVSFFNPRISIGSQRVENDNDLYMDRHNFAQS